MKIEEVPIDRIVVGWRYRRHFGDLDALAANIHAIGLLQPIGVDENYKLIFGARRLEVCKDILKWQTISCVVMKLDSVLAGEYAENEFRKQFTTSEREAIGRAIETQLGKRQGQRTDLAAIAAKSEKGKSVDIAAKAAGFKSAETYECAKTVIKKGTPELIAAMDSGDIAVSAAAIIATQPKTVQSRVIAMPKKDRQAEIKKLREQEARKREDEDIRLFRGLYNNVKAISKFNVDARLTWEGMGRVLADDFAEYLPAAIECLVRIEREGPNAARQPRPVVKA